MGENDLRWLLWALGAIQSALTLVVAAGVKALFSLSARIGEQNGRMQRLEQWKDDRVGLSEQRHQENREAHTKLWKAVDAVRFGEGRAGPEG